jgi:hypothetical protein
MTEEEIDRLIEKEDWLCDNLEYHLSMNDKWWRGITLVIIAYYAINFIIGLFK